MLLISQNREKLFDFEKVLLVEVIYSDRNWHLLAKLIDGNDYHVGIFNSEEDAKKEIKNIYQAVWEGYRYHKISQLNKEGKPYSPTKEKEDKLL